MKILNWRGGITERVSFSRKGEANVCEVYADEGQANKSARGMPWHQEPMKDVTSCEKFRGAANKRRSGNIRMWEHT